MNHAPPGNPRDDPWLTGPLGVLTVAFALVAFADGYAGIGAALLVNALFALGRSTLLVRRRREPAWERPPLASTAQSLWLPLVLGVVVGATVGSFVHGALAKQVAVGVLAGAWGALCTTLAFAYGDWWLGGRGR